MLVDDHKIVRDALGHYFEGKDSYRLAFEAQHGMEALKLYEQHADEIDLIITDLSMPEMDGIQLVQEIRQVEPDQKILALSMVDEVRHIRQLLSIGINGYLLKNSTEEEILTAVEKIMDGETYFSQQVTKSVMDFMGGVKPKKRLTVETPLSKREKEVIRLIANEYSNQEIADKLFISNRTVESHKRNLLEKTGAKNVAGLVLYAVEHNFIEHEPQGYA